MLIIEEKWKWENTHSSKNWKLQYKQKYSVKQTTPILHFNKFKLKISYRIATSSREIHNPSYQPNKTIIQASLQWNTFLFILAFTHKRLYCISYCWKMKIENAVYVIRNILHYAIVLALYQCICIGIDREREKGRGTRIESRN